MKVYKIPDGNKNVPVRKYPTKYAGIDYRLNAGDKVFSDREQSDYVRIVEVEQPGYGKELVMQNCWVWKGWLKYVGEKERE